MAFLILTRHIIQGYISKDNVIYYVVADSVSTIGVPTFFVISGFLFFYKNNTNISKQCARLLKLYIFYSIIYCPFEVKNLLNEGYNSLGLLLRYIQEFFFKGTYYHLWYVPSLIVGLLICAWLDKKDNVKADIIAFILLVIGLIGRNYYSLIPGCTTIVMAYNRIFLSFCNGLFWGCPMIWIGRNLCKYNTKQLKNYKLLGVLFLTIPLLFVESYWVRHITLENVNSNLFMADIIAVVIVIWGIKYPKLNVPDKLSRKIRNFATCLYFIHPLVLLVVQFVSEKCLNMETSREIVLECLLATVTSLLIILLSEKNKFLKILY